MSPSIATYVFSLPPVRGALSLLFLVLVTAVPLQDGEMATGLRIALFAILLLMGAVVWVVTLRGFLRDVRGSRHEDEVGAASASPARSAQRLLSWLALAVVIVLGPTIGVLIAQGSAGGLLVLCGIVFAAATAAATLLPGLGRRRTGGHERTAASAATPTRT